MTTWTPLPGRAFKNAGMVATSVLPSPVSSSAMQRLWIAMPPTICTSNWRWPIARLAASRDQGKRLDQQAVERIALSGSQPQSVGSRLELLRAEDLVERLECVDPLDQDRVAAQPAGMGRSGQLLNSIQPRWGQGDWPWRVILLFGLASR